MPKITETLNLDPAFVLRLGGEGIEPIEKGNSLSIFLVNDDLGI